ncbi:MAG: putative sensory/regulatory protein RpfC [Pseudomonadota bacterium]|jgi:PAS domain S-box-containing protein
MFQRSRQRLRRAWLVGCLWLGALWTLLPTAQAQDFQPIFETHSSVMLLVDPAEGQIVDANPAAAAFYGYDRETLRRMHIAQINTLTEEQLKAERELASQSGRNVFIFRHTLQNRDIRTVEVYSSPIIQNGRTLLLSVVHDITPQRNLNAGLWYYQDQLEEMVSLRTAELQTRSQWLMASLLLVSVLAVAWGLAVRRKKQLAVALSYRQGLFGALSEKSGMLSGLVDPAGRLCEVNQPALQLVDMPAQMVLGQPFIDSPWWHDIQKPRLREAMTRAAQGQADSFETYHRTPQGQRIDIQFHAAPVSVGGQNFVSVTGIDITDVKTRARREQRNNRLLSAVFDHAEVGLALVSAQGQWLKVNEPFAHALGMSCADILQTGFDWQSFFETVQDSATEPGQDTPPSQCGSQQDFVDSGLVREPSEFWFVQPDGQRKWVQFSARAVHDDNGQVEYVVLVLIDITQRKEAEAALLTTQEAALASLARLREAEAIASMGHWVLDLHTQRMEWSEQAHRMAGLPVGSDVPLAQFNELIHPDDQAAVNQAWVHAIKTRGLYEVEHRIVVGGEVRWMRETAHLDRVKDGKVMGTVLDISKQRLLEEQMALQKRRLQSILEGTHVGTWEWHVQTGAAVFNEYWADIVGYTLAELEPVSIKTWLKLAHPEDLARSNELLQQHFATGQGFYDHESRMRHKDGHWVWVHDRGKVASWSASGQPLWMAGTHQDITQRKLAEAVLLDTQTRLQQSEHLLIDTEQLALVGGWVYQVATGKMYWTPGLYRLHEFEDRPDFDHIQASIQCYREEDRPRIVQAFEACIRELKPYDLVVPFVTPSGRQRWIRTKTKPVAQQGQALSVLGIVMDVTEQVQTEVDLQAALEQARQLTVKAEAANTAKSRFLATMSHELRTPLNGVLGMAHMLLTAPMDETKLRSHARTILQSGELLLNLLNDILDLSKVEAGQLSLNPGVVAPAELLAHVCTLFAPSAEAKGLDLRGVWLGEPVQRYQGDAYRLQQMLSNLVSNAIKFTSEGTIEVQAQQHEADADTAVLLFVVTDTGMGIAADQLPLLFQPFRQLDDGSARQFGGTGLGLSIVKSLARQMGGEVGVDSEHGQGSRFWFRVRLPRLPDATQADAHTAHTAYTDDTRPQAPGDVMALSAHVPPSNNALLPKPTVADWSRWWHDLAEVLSLLADAKFTAVERFDVLREQARGAPFEADLAAMEADIQAFRFVQAHAAVQALIERNSSCNP